MSAPHLAQVLAGTQAQLQAQSKGEGDRLRTCLKAELARTEAALGTAVNGDAWVGLVKQKGRLLDALQGLG